MPVLRTRRAYVWVAVIVVIGSGLSIGIMISVADGRNPSRKHHDSALRSGHVLVTEMMDVNDGGRFSGLFAAHWESENGKQSEMGPDSVSAQEAIAWGRRRSDVVLVQVGGGEDGHYSAGKTAALDDETKLWPPGGLPIAARPEGSSLDGSEQEVLWTVEANVTLSKDICERVLSTLETYDLIEEINGRSEEVCGSFSVVVRASGTRPAILMVWNIVNKAVAATGHSIDPSDLDLTLDVQRKRED